MRITNNMLINNMMYFMNNNLDRMQKYQGQLATGKKINVPSDDPIVAAKALKLRTDVSEIEQYNKNSGDAYSWMDITENTMSGLTDILQRTRELAVQGASSGTLTQNDREKIRQEIEELRGQAIHLANTTYAGRYIFSGYATDTKLMNEDGTYATSVSSNETAVIKSGLLEEPIVIDGTNNEFKICLDGSSYPTVTIPFTAPSTSYTINNLVNAIQTELSANASLRDIRVINDGERIAFSLKETTDSNGNPRKIYIQEVDGFLDSINLKVDPVNGKVVSNSEDINYQVGISDLLNINVPGTELFGTGVKGDVGEFVVAFNRFIDALNFPDDGKSYIHSQTLSPNSTDPIDLTINNQFYIQVEGMGAPQLVTLNNMSYTSSSMAALVSDIQSKITAIAGATNVNVSYQNGKLQITESTGLKVTLQEGIPGKNALIPLKIFTGDSNAVTSVTSNEGISKSITALDKLRDTLMSMRSSIGARMNRAELTINRLDNDEVNFTKLMSENEDVDMADAIMKLKNEENVYRASLDGGARVIQPTLLDFLK